ncbi:MAG TPA: S9 family peptidase [Mycobacteriales bacterium]|nr:S9 family peptidase [Mycobacteriales bacterium]
MSFDIDSFLSTPRVSGLALSPDGSRLITSVARLSGDGKKFKTALWLLDPDGAAEPVRLTRSAPGESSPAFLPDGSVLFTSCRPDADADPDDDSDDVPQLWLLPAAGGEARQVACRPGGVDAVAVARDAGTVVYGAAVAPGASTVEEDRDWTKRRKDADVSAVLWDSYPIRYWDHNLGPQQRRLFAAPAPAGAADELGAATDLTPDPRGAIDVTELAGFDVTPDGRTVVVGWTATDDMLDRATQLVAIDVASAEQRVLAAEDKVLFNAPTCSPDGRLVAATRYQVPAQVGEAPDVTLWVVDLETGEGRDPAPELDLWPHDSAWSPDSRFLYFTADCRGQVPVFRVDVAGGEVVRLTAEGAYSELCPSPDGTRLYALRSSVAEPPVAVVLDAAAVEQQGRPLPTPGGFDELPGQVLDVEATADDGVTVRSWLVLPKGASADAPAPLVVWVHGGPLASWTTWSWRWCPHLLVERGFAVLMPDPALSTGYGRDFIQRGAGAWGERPFTDVMAAVDAAEGRPEIDESRTALMGGSFGGYLANWVAGHTDRFKGIVTHASLWGLDTFHGGTDDAVFWEWEIGNPYTQADRLLAHSPHKHVADISTPMLVIHGERDFRVPIAEGLRLYTDLKRHGVDARFLYFPDENHWILKPQNSRIWYDTVYAFLDHYLLGKNWAQPALL